MFSVDINNLRRTVDLLNQELREVGIILDLLNAEYLIRAAQMEPGADELRNCITAMEKERRCINDRIDFIENSISSTDRALRIVREQLTQAVDQTNAIE